MIWNNIKINVQKRSSSLYTLTAFPGSPLRLQTSVKPFSSNYLVQKFDHNIQRWWSEASRRYRNASAASGAILFQCNYEKNTDSTISAKHLDSVCSELRNPVKTNRGASWKWKEWTEIMWTMIVIKHITNQEGTKLITENTEHQFDSKPAENVRFHPEWPFVFITFMTITHISTILSSLYSSENHLFGQNYYAFN